jgi:hypothetical protein
MGWRQLLRRILFDVAQTRSAGRFAVNHSPAGWSGGEGRSPAVLLVGELAEKAAVVVVDGLIPTGSPDRLSPHEWNKP